MTHEPQTPEPQTPYPPETLELTSEAVQTLFAKCLRDEGEGVLTHGVVVAAILDTTGHEDEIGALLGQLPDQFKAEVSGGWSFLNGCLRKDETIWTGEHRTVDMLLVLGLAANKAAFVFPRDVWPSLPGGVPYFRVI